MKFFFKMFLIFLFTHPVYGGDKVLNGGNVIVCANSSGSIQSVELLDYYEVRLNGGSLRFNSNLPSFNGKLIDLFEKWQNIAPKRIALYRKWLSEFPEDAGLYTGINIPAIPDTGSIAIPKGCSLEPVAFQRSDDDVFPGTKRYVINKDLWDLMNEEQKAGLVLHELIYREAIKVGNKTSLPTRFLNGHLASSEPNSEKYAYIVSQMPLEWVEVGGGMVLHVGRVNCQFGSNCEFKRDLIITPDGKTIRGNILQFINTVSNQEIKIHFKNLPNIIYDWGKFKIDFESGVGIKISKDRELKPNICTHIIDFFVKDIFGFYDIEAANCYDLVDSVSATSPMNIFDVYTKVNPIKSWFRNVDQTFIKDVSIVNSGHSLIQTLDHRTWYYYPQRNYTAYEKCSYARYDFINILQEYYNDTGITKGEACEKAKIQCTKYLRPKDSCEIAPWALESSLR